MVVIRTDYFHVSPDGKQRIPLDQSFVREAQALSPGSELNIFGRYRFEEFRDREKKGWKVESRSVYGDGSSR